MAVLLKSLIIGVVLVAPGLVSAAGLSKPANNLGLVGYWSFNEGTSTTATDFSGRGNTGTWSGTPSWVSGARGKAMASDGSTNYVSVPDSPSIRLNRTYTVSAWIYVTGSQGSFRIFFAKNFGASGYPQFMVSNNNKIDWRANHDTTYGVLSNNAIELNRWYHVVGTYDADGGSGNSKLYVNGVLENSETLSGAAANSAAALLIGRRSDSFRYPGYVDEVRVYNRALTATEVAALYGSGGAKLGGSRSLTTGTTLEQGLVGHWSMDGADVTDKVYDRAGGNNGYFIGGATSSAKVAGKLGQGMQFDGVDDYTSTTYSTGSTASLGTVSVWFKTSSQTSDSVSILRPIVIQGQCDGSSASGMCIEISMIRAGSADYGKIRARWGDDQTGNWFTTATYNDGLWHQATLVKSGSSFTLYIDGVSVLTASATDTVSTATTLQIGGSSTVAARRFTGIIDDVRVYNRALSAAEVKQLYGLGGAKLQASGQTMTNGSPLQAGLVGYWSFNGADVTDKVYDRTGYANNGYFVGSATSSAKVSGKSGQALSFNGSSYVSVPYNSSLAPTGAISFGGWFKTSNVSGATRILSRTQVGGYNLAFNDVETGLTATVNVGGDYFYVNNTTLQNNEWYHAFVTYDGDTLRLYVNGVETDTNTDPSGSVNYTVTTPLCIGSEAASTNCAAGNYFPGTIDEVRIYNRALAATEVQQLYTLGK